MSQDFLGSFGPGTLVVMSGRTSRDVPSCPRTSSKDIPGSPKLSQDFLGSLDLGLW